MKIALCASALAVALLGGQVCEAAGPDINVVTNGHRGSILAFPLINVDDGWDTFIEISNDQYSNVKIKCVYVNEQKGRNDFVFDISAQGTVSWDVKLHVGDHVTPQVWPTDSNWTPPKGWAPADVDRGELICIAVDATGGEAIAFNRLHGTATVFATGLIDPPAEEPKQAFKYNAFAFRAWDVDDLAVDGTVMGGCALSDPACKNPPAVFLPLTGAVGGTKCGTPGGGTGCVYDACPAVNSTPFMPAGAVLGNLRTTKTWIHGIGCNQDLRDQDFGIYTTKLDFSVWNSDEVGFSGSHVCVDSVYSVLLGNSFDTEPWLTNARNFWFSTLGTPNAKFWFQGDQDNSFCPGSSEVGVLTVVVAKIAIATPNPILGGPPVFILNPNDYDQTVANTMMTVGAQSGFILFTPGL